MRGWGRDLPRRRGKSIGGDLDVDNEGSEHNFESLQSLQQCSIRYQSVKQELTSPRRLIPASFMKKTSKNEVEAF
jgi:hypothetical protein